MVVGDANVLPDFLTLLLTQLFFLKPQLLFSHASSEVRGENMPDRKFASIGDPTHNHQVMSPTRSPLPNPRLPLSHPGRAQTNKQIGKRKNGQTDKAKTICPQSIDFGT